MLKGGHIGKMGIGSCLFPMLKVLLLLVILAPGIAYGSRKTISHNINVVKVIKSGAEEKLSMATLFSNLKPKSIIPRPSGPSLRHNTFGLQASPPS